MTVRLGARDFYRVIVERSVDDNENNKQNDYNLHLTELTLLYEQLKSNYQTYD